MLLSDDSGFSYIPWKSVDAFVSLDINLVRLKLGKYLPVMSDNSDLGSGLDARFYVSALLMHGVWVSQTLGKSFYI